MNPTNISFSGIWKLAYPIILSGFAQHLVQFVDAAFLAQVGENELAGAGNAGLLYTIFFIVGYGLCVGAQIIMSRRNGEQNHVATAAVYKQSFIIQLVLSFLFWLGMQACNTWLLPSLIRTPEVLTHAVTYLNWRSIGIFFILQSSLITAYFVSIKQTAVLTKVTLLLTLTNIAHDYGLVLGKFGFPAMGVTGAAIASVISELTVLIYLILYAGLIKMPANTSLRPNLKINTSLITDIMKTASPVMLQLFISLTAWFIFFTMIEWLGPKELAVSQVVKSIYMLVMVPVFGFSGATATLIGNLLGENRANEVLQSIRNTVLLGILVNLFSWLILHFFGSMIVKLFTEDPTTLQLALESLGVIEIAMFLFVPAMITFSGIAATGNTLHSLIIESVTIAIYLLAAWMIMQIPNIPLRKVWYAEFVYFSVMLCFSLTYMLSGKWKNKVI